MSEPDLYLLPPGIEAANSHWPVLLDGGQQGVQRSTLEAVGPRLAGQAVVLVLPMELCGFCSLEPLPERRPRRETLAYAAEDQLATPLETSHLVFSKPDAKGRRRGLVIESEVLNQVLALLRGNGIEPLAVQVDADRLDTAQACALWFEGRWLLGGAGETRLAVSADNAPLLARLSADRLWWAEAGQAPAGISSQQAVSALGVLAGGRGTALDLLQGGFARRRVAMPWRQVGIAVTMAALVLCADQHLRAERLIEQVAQARADNLEAFSRWAPDQPAGGDLAARISALEQRPRSVTALEQLTGLAVALVETGNLRIERAESLAEGGWRLHVVAQGFADLERLRRRSPMLQVEHTRQAEDGVRATLAGMASQ